MVFNFVAKARQYPNLVPVIFFSFEIYPYILFHFLKYFKYYSTNIRINLASPVTVVNYTHLTKQNPLESTWINKVLSVNVLYSYIAYVTMVTSFHYYQEITIYLVSDLISFSSKDIFARVQPTSNWIKLCLRLVRIHTIIYYKLVIIIYTILYYIIYTCICRSDFRIGSYIKVIRVHHDLRKMIITLVWND